MTNSYPVAAFLAQLGNNQAVAISGKLPFHRIDQSARPKCDKELIEEAYRRGISEGRAAALSECEAVHSLRLKATNDAHAAERLGWVQSESADLARQIADGLAIIENSIAVAAVAALEPFLEDCLLRKAKTDLSAKLSEIMGQNGHCRIVLRGSKDILAYLQSAIPQSVDVQFEEVSSPPTVVIGDTIIQTTLADWVNVLRSGSYE